MTRESALSSWTRQQIARLDVGDGWRTVKLEPLSGDASFRRYFRATLEATSFIVVDAPPESEDNETFVRIARAFRKAGVMTPVILAVDYQQGFMLQEDFGDTLYLQVLQQNAAGSEQVHALYRHAIDALVTLQSNVSPAEFPPYDRQLLLREMQLFQDWFCVRFLELALSPGEIALISDSQAFLAEQVLAQPRVVVHRDYHSRNLMIPDSDRYPATAVPGVIDFQDAVIGAYTYDLVSLLRDCYISWPSATIAELLEYYRQQAEERSIISGIDRAKLGRDFDLMGLQRHLKVIGIFARLCIRDSKPQFLADIPQTIRYFTQVAATHPELVDLLDWFEDRILPLAQQRLPERSS